MGGDNTACPMNTKFILDMYNTYRQALLVDLWDFTNTLSKVCRVIYMKTVLLYASNNTGHHKSSRK